MSSTHLVCPHCDAINRVPSARLGDGPQCGVCHKPLCPGTPLALTPANFRRQLDESDLPVLVDFWAPWCGPCRMMAPVFEQAAARFAASVRLAKLNTEEHPQLAGQFGIRGIPTLILFHRGREVDRLSGALPFPQLVSWIESRK
jgi:thioredoxin 2